MNSELAKFVSDPRYADLTPEQRWDAFGKLEPRFQALKDDAERDKFIGMVEGRFRQPVGSEKTGLPGPALVAGARMDEVDAPSLPGALADVAVGLGRGLLHTVEGAGGTMRALGAEEAGKAVSDFGSKNGQAPHDWIVATHLRFSFRSEPEQDCPSCPRTENSAPPANY